MRDRMAEIKKKGFDMRIANDTDERYKPQDFSKIKIGAKTLEDAIVSYGDYQKTNPRLGNKQNVLKAIMKRMR